MDTFKEEFKEKLADLLKPYVEYNSHTQRHEIHPELEINNELMSRLEADFIRLISQELTAGSPAFDEIKKRYKSLSLLFHQDKIKQNTNSLIYCLEQILSENNNRGACFKCLNFCYARLNPENKKKNISFDHINNMEDFKQWLMKQKENSETRTQTDLYDALIKMVEQMHVHSKDTQVIKQNFMRALLLQLPVFMAGYCVFIFADELIAVYGVCFISLKLGQYLERSQSQHLRHFGQKMQEISSTASIYTTSLLARVIEMSFWLTNQSYHTASSIAATLLRPMITEPPEFSAATSEKMENALMLADKEKNKGCYFETPQLKMVASHIESYLALNEQQWFIQFRTGWQKRESFKSALMDLKEIDRNHKLSLTEKITSARTIIQSLKEQSWLYGSGVNAPLAVDNALLTLKWYESNSKKEEKEVVNCIVEVESKTGALELFEI
ncbi:hypothetical protein E3983_05945 [Legionella israelensis]|uniref:J domain-containing protein n=1 Tax=Legionella israelensis TaxID=454 RepID=A0AAX1EFP1_9GAMM|nr:hypothetical protein [Legionella israelensis]QBR83928.1 hypothetical protein E3983_05945 [Legionella israelensis]